MDHRNVTGTGRRQFLRTISSASVSVAGSMAGYSATAALTCQSSTTDVGAAAPRPDSVDAVMVDAHLHCFAGPDDKRFPYHSKAPYRPTEAASPEELIQCMDEGGIDYAIVVHPEPYQDDHRYLEYCLQTGKGRLKGTCLFFADDPDCLRRMRDLSNRLPLVAARVHAYSPDRLPPFGSPELKALWKSAGELGLAIQLHLEPRYAPALESLIRDLPDTRVIIDHLGRPMQGTVEEHDVIVRWARYPHTIMKLSAIPQTRNYPHRDPTAVIQRLLAEYGADRMIYGGGFAAGATGASYRAAFESARALPGSLSPVDQSKIFGLNAVREFGFSV